MKQKLSSKFTIEMQSFILENYPRMTYKELTEAFNKEFNTTYSYWYMRVGITPMVYKKNKLNIKDAKPSTQFKKGNSNIYRRKKVGDEYFEKRSNSWYVKIIDDTGKEKWKIKTRYLYEKYHGEIPKGYAVIFRNGNRNDFSKRNLVAIPYKYVRTIAGVGIMPEGKIDNETLNTILLIAEVYEKIRKVKEK